MEQAADGFIRDASHRIAELGAVPAKDRDRDAYDRARGDLRDARTAAASIRLMGPGAS